MVTCYIDFVFGNLGSNIVGIGLTADSAGASFIAVAQGFSLGFAAQRTGLGGSAGGISPFMCAGILRNSDIHMVPIVGTVTDAEGSSALFQIDGCLSHIACKFLPAMVTVVNVHLTVHHRVGDVQEGDLGGTSGNGDFQLGCFQYAAGLRTTRNQIHFCVTNQNGDSVCGLVLRVSRKRSHRQHSQHHAEHKEQRKNSFFHANKPPTYKQGFSLMALCTIRL